MKGRVLVVDDEQQILSMLQRHFREKYDLVVESRGQRALDRLLTGEDYDVVLCDLILPYLNGMSLYRSLVQARLDVAERVIFITGDVLSPAVISFFKHVKNKCVEKPFDMIELEAAIDVLMKARGK